MNVWHDAWKVPMKEYENYCLRSAGTATSVLEFKGVGAGSCGSYHSRSIGPANYG